jgi:hypothetical protein
MSRFAEIALAAAIGWAASLTMAHAIGARDVHTPGHAAKGGSGVTTRQDGPPPAERHRPKEIGKNIRRLNASDKASPKHSHRSPAVVRQTTKQTGRNIRLSSRTTHIDAKEKSPLVSSQYRKLRRGIKVNHTVVKKVPAGDKQPGRHGRARKS